MQICSNPCWTVYDITDMFYTGEEETCNVVVLRGSEVLELQDVTFTPTRDADGNVTRGDMILGLNRLSSLMWIFMIKLKAGRYERK